MSDQATSSQKSDSVFNELRLKAEFCDATIIVDDVEFQIHKIILCNCSPYFRALFSRWSTPDRKIFTIRGLSHDIMQLIVDFAYTGSVSVMKSNVQDLMLAADMLNVTGVVQACSEFLSQQLYPENCIGIWQFTSTCHNSELQRKAYRYITDHFEEVVPTEEFLQLSAEDLADILDKDELNVRNESAVFEAILHWITHVPEERGRHIAILLSKVRLALTSVEYIRGNVMSNDLVTNNAECLDLTFDAIQVICNNESGLSSELHRPRLPYAMLLAIGGWSGGDPTNAIEAYNVRTNCWINVTNNMERPRAYHGAVYLNGDVYCIGGFDRVEHFNSVRRFDLSSHTWYEVAPMHSRRCYVSVTVLDGLIYAMGGYDGHTRLSTAERYRPATNQWSLIAPMHEQRSDASCTTLHDKVYICGGFNGNECLQTAEYYNPKTNQWTIIAPMNSRRSGIGIIAYADHVYAVGGFDGNNRLRSVEAYNPRTNTWNTVSSMITCRSNFGLEVFDERIFAVGGFNGVSTSTAVEYYDAAADVWSPACDMEIFRSALSCCVVFGLPNMVEYAFPHIDLPLLSWGDESVESDSI